FVAIQAGSISLLRRCMDKCRELLAGGMSLLIFPEGRRVSSSALMPFADFAFRMAVECSVPIVPVVIHSDRPFLNRQKGSFFPPETVLFRIRFLEPISTVTERDPVHISDLVSRRMVEELAKLDSACGKSTPSGVPS
ncbi:MAG: lysophospholipid acyltransferase family protein, partial [Lentisphaerota bacterium]